MMYVDCLSVARILDGRIQVLAAQVFDGFKHYVPDGCDVSLVTPGSHHAAPGRIAGAIEHRMRARAKSLPVPADPGAIVRDP